MSDAVFLVLGECQISIAKYLRGYIKFERDRYNITEAHHDRRRVKHRGSDKKQRDMQDVLNIFLELPLHAIPIFVCKDISNLPPLSMNNFDMASVIRSIETLQVQVNLLTENHTKSVNAQVTLCKHLIPSADNTTQAAVDPTSDTLPAVNTSEINAGNAEHQHHSIFSDDNSDGGDEVVTVIGDSDSDEQRSHSISRDPETYQHS